jgi:hypothetical protein
VAGQYDLKQKDIGSCFLVCWMHDTAKAHEKEIQGLKMSNVSKNLINSFKDYLEDKNLYLESILFNSMD